MLETTDLQTVLARLKLLHPLGTAVNIKPAQARQQSEVPLLQSLNLTQVRLNAHQSRSFSLWNIGFRS